MEVKTGETQRTLATSPPVQFAKRVVPRTSFRPLSEPGRALGGGLRSTGRRWDGCISDHCGVPRRSVALSAMIAVLSRWRDTILTSCAALGIGYPWAGARNW